MKPQSTHDPPDEIAGRYTLKQHLGDGGFAHVYRAYDSLLDRDVAIKFLMPERVSAQDSTRFLREARAVARLSHPNIVLIYDMGQQDKWHYLVLEYVHGITLHEYRIQNDGILPLDEAVSTVRDVLNGLSYAHQSGLVHRDIKPENIMLTHDGQVKVMDFGLALRASDVRITASDAFVGSVLYLAPEVVDGGTIDARTDLYSVGAMLYELLTGEPPFDGDTTLSVITRLLTMPVSSPRLISPHIPEQLEAIILKLLEKEPDQRYASAQELLQALPTASELVEATAEMMRRTISQRLSHSLLERIVRSSSSEHQRPDMDDEGLLSENPTSSLAQELLVFAAQEDTLEALEAERRRVALHIQETIINHINLILSQANAYEASIAGNPQAQMAVSVLATLIRQLLQQTLDLEASLHPVLLESLGLEPALESLVGQQIRTSGMNITLAVQRMRERLPGQIELALYRTTQDVIDRAVRKANASQMVIQLEKADDHVVFIIEDDGLPPDPNVLRNSRQRIEGLGGGVTLKTGKYGGLQLVVRFALEAPVQLTEREIEVIQYLTEGLTNKEIAALLQISPRTIKFHLDNIYSKLNVNSRTEAAIYALRQGWVRRNTVPTGRG